MILALCAVLAGTAALGAWRTHARLGGATADAPAVAPVTTSDPAPAGIDGQTHASIAPASRNPTEPRNSQLAADLERRFQAEPGRTYALNRLSDQQATLLAAARQGDVIATRTLSRGLAACPAYLPRDEAELGELRAQIDSGARSLFRLPSEPAEHGHARLNTFLDACGFLPAGLHDQEYALVAQLAQAGDHEARIDFAFLAYRIDGRAPNAAELRAAHPEIARQYLESELAAGNPLALRAMARSHDEGVLHRRDPVMAYAYAYAASLTPGDHRVLLETLPGRASRLSAEQRASAERLARDILRSCCS